MDRSGASAPSTTRKPASSPSSVTSVRCSPSSQTSRPRSRALQILPRGAPSTLPVGRFWCPATAPDRATSRWPRGTAAAGRAETGSAAPVPTCPTRCCRGAARGRPACLRRWRRGRRRQGRGAACASSRWSPPPSCSAGARWARSPSNTRSIAKRDLHRALSYVTLLASTLAQAIAASRAAHERQRLQRRNQSNSATRCTSRSIFRGWSGTAHRWGEVQTQVAQVASSNTTVLLRGRIGHGQGLIAQAIHHNSPRAKKPFVTVSCAALPARI